MKPTDKKVYEYTAKIFDYKCALCGNPEYVMHHIRYGACSRKTYVGNVIALCPEHHRIVHTNKKMWQEVLLKVVYARIERKDIFYGKFLE